jgi:putative endonuclease
MYILRCSDGSYYTGSTAKEMEQRLWEHNNDDDVGAAFTRKRRPAEVAYCEWGESIEAAFARERQIHGWSRAKKEALINGNPGALPELSRGRGGPSTSSGTVVGSRTVDGPATAGGPSTSSGTVVGSRTVDGPATAGGPSTSSGTVAGTGTGVGSGT